MDRADVYQRLDGERAYHDGINASILTPAEELLLIDRYVQKAKERYAAALGDRTDPAIMESLRKIGAMCVRAMEHHPTPERGAPEPEGLPLPGEVDKCPEIGDRVRSTPQAELHPDLIGALGTIIGSYPSQPRVLLDDFWEVRFDPTEEWSGRDGIGMEIQLPRDGFELVPEGEAANEFFCGQEVMAPWQAGHGQAVNKTRAKVVGVDPTNPNGTRYQVHFNTDLEAWFYWHQLEAIFCYGARVVIEIKSGRCRGLDGVEGLVLEDHGEFVTVDAGNEVGTRITISVDKQFLRVIPDA